MIKKRLIVALLWAFPICCQAQINTASVDSIVRVSVRDNAFEGTVLVADRGNAVYHQAFGHTDPEQDQEITPETHFSIASITKMITAILVLQLVEEKRLSLTDTLSQRLPALNIPPADSITVHQLLLHISGLPSEPDTLYNHPVSPQEFVTETMGDRRTLSGYGQFNYTNIDYVLLGLIIEQVAGKSWYEVVNERIIDKLQLANTGFLAQEEYPDDFAYSYSYNEQGERVPDPPFHIENFYAAGSMYSTTQDLLTLDQAMYGTTLLSEESKALMFTSYPEYNYTGYGVWTYQYPFAKSTPLMMERRGGILGANSVLVRMLDTNQTIIILSNNNRFNPDSFGDKNNLREALIIAIADSSR